MKTNPNPAPLTSWNRGKWAALADKMLLAVRPYASAEHARIILPGDGRGFGIAVDGLEGFARTFLLAGFRLKGENGNDPLGLADWYARGIVAGTDPDADESERWIRMSEDMQAKVEAASIALMLDMTRPWIWEKLSDTTKQNVIDYLSEAVGDETFVKNNWLWFRLIIQTFLRSVGGPHSLAEMQADLAQHESYYRSGGWYSDGPPRAYDHYEGWAMHLYPTLWANMQGAEDLAGPRRPIEKERLARYLADAVRLVGADGAPLIQGRSLIYRFATAAPYWLGAFADVDSVPLGQLRRAAAGIMDYFGRHGAPDSDGVLNVGWFGPWLPLAQGYSGPSSPYWAVKGMSGLKLPADHPAWHAVEEPLPVQTGSQLFAIEAPNWIVYSNPSDGIVRVVNHGSDNGYEGDKNGDSPLYARLAYSTATFPWLDRQSWESPTDNIIGLVNQTGQVTHRSGFTPLGAKIIDDAGVQIGWAGSSGTVRWLNHADPDQFDAGRGLVGETVTAGHVTIVTVVRGSAEVRLARIDSLEVEPAGLRLRFSGWPITGADELASTVTALGADAASAKPGKLVATHPEGTTPFGSPAEIPYVEFPVQPGSWYGAYVALSRNSQAASEAPKGLVLNDDDSATIVWSDGVATNIPLPKAV